MLKTQHKVLITGANRGLGLEFTKQYAADGWQVISCCREPKTAAELMSLASQYPQNIQVYTLDVADFVQIDKLALELKTSKIDVLINNAGVYPESSFGSIDYDEWAYCFKINTMAPYKMTEAFAEHVAASSLKQVVVLSSKMGSMSENTSGGSYAYRTSKTATNMMMKSLSIDLKSKGIACGILHPGWVQTDMGGPNGLINAATSVRGLRQVISELNISNCGRFIAFDGKEIAW